MTEATTFLLFVSIPAVSGVLLLFLPRWLRGTGGKRRPKPWIAANVLIFVFLASTVLVGFESYYRFVYDTTDSFNYTLASRRWFERHYHRNSSKLRDDIEYYNRIAPGKRRIVFLGDSFTAGHGVPSVENRFSNRIRKEHPAWEVHVVAEMGYDTGEEIRSLEARVRHGYQLDTVVLVYCLNDISDLEPEWQATLARIQSRQERLGWLARTSYVFNTIHYRMMARRDRDVADYYACVRDAYRGPAWEQQKARLAELCGFVRSSGGRLLVVTFPFLHALGPGYEYGFVHEELVRYWRFLGVPHLDLLTVYGSLPPSTLTVSRIDAHPNEHAHALAAQAISSFLAVQIQAGPRPPA